MNRPTNLTELFSECFHKADILVRTIDIGWRQRSKTKMTVVYQGIEMEITVDLKEGLKGLQQAVYDQYEDYMATRILIAKNEAEYYKSKMNQFSRMRSREAKKA